MYEITLTGPVNKKTLINILLIDLSSSGVNINVNFSNVHKGKALVGERTDVNNEFGIINELEPSELHKYDIIKDRYKYLEKRNLFTLLSICNKKLLFMSSKKDEDYLKHFLRLYIEIKEIFITHL